MTSMTRLTLTFLLCLSSLALKPVVADELTIDFTYERNVNIGSISPSLHLAPFADERCLLYTSPSPRDKRQSRMPSSA